MFILHAIELLLFPILNSNFSDTSFQCTLYSPCRIGLHFMSKLNNMHQKLHTFQTFHMHFFFQRTINHCHRVTSLCVLWTNTHGSNISWLNLQNSVRKIFLQLIREKNTTPEHQQQQMKKKKQRQEENATCNHKWLRVTSACVVPFLSVFVCIERKNCYTSLWLWLFIILYSFFFSRSFRHSVSITVFSRSPSTLF